ncbi:alpha/beta hydrolase [Streptomyces sp. NPDC020801]|uniref:alpha/beta hydrolase n=1 Tax=Streptomyces sp. NPDC020801 TaxID=3365093 RepID=UPI003799EDF5
MPRTAADTRCKRRLRNLTCAAISLALLGLPACGAPGPHGSRTDAHATTQPPLPATLTKQKVHWHPCAAPDRSEGQGAAPGSAWECASLRVPLDYAEPAGETIKLALIRTRAERTDKRLGSLIFNFGGPGASGVATLPEYSGELFRLRSRYDLVSFDPRGVGLSRGVTCLNGADLDDYFALDPTPDTPAERDLLRKADREYVAACRKNSGKVLPHLDTESAARDIDLLRQVLGDKKTSYFGVSYGTQLGAVYAHLFPHKVGKLVLDAAVDPGLSPVQSDLQQTRGFQLALEHYMKNCARQTAGCPTGRGGQEGTDRITSLLRRLDAHPLPTAGDRRLTTHLAELGVAAALYASDGWSALTKGLSQAMDDHQGDILLALADLYLGRDSQGHYSTEQASHTAISCADTSERISDRRAAQLLPQFLNASPVFGPGAAARLTECSGWPVRGKSAHPNVRAVGAGPILVIGQTGDPATPFAGARNLARALGDGVGVDIAVEGEGHGAYFSDNVCLTGLVDNYLLHQVVPPRGTQCRPSTSTGDSRAW